MTYKKQITKQEYAMNLRDLSDTLADFLLEPNYTISQNIENLIYNISHIVNGNQSWDTEDYNFVMKRLTKKLPDWFDHQ